MKGIILAGGSGTRLYPKRAYRLGKTAYGAYLRSCVDEHAWDRAPEILPDRING